MSRRLLFTCWPFEGHVLPQLSIALALREQGHEAAFYTAASARELVERAGFPVFPFERVDEQRFARVHSMERATGGRRQSARVARTAFTDWLVETIPDQVADLRAVSRRWHPDAVAADLSMWGPILVLWEADAIPVAISSTMMGPMIPGPDAPPWGFGLRPPRTRRTRAVADLAAAATEVAARPMRRRIDEIRARYGLPPLGCSVNAFTGRLPLYLVPSLPELDYGRRDLPASVAYVGHCLWHPPEPPGSREWLERVPSERPWVHVTEGTSHFKDPFVLRAAIHGLGGRPLEVIATTGSRRHPRDMGLGAFPPNVHVARWLSHAHLLPRCAAVVTTGGPATVMAALAAGVPLVVVPTTWDKPDNARRVVEAGVGVRVGPRRCTPERLAAAVEEVLRDPRYAAGARRARERLAAAPGPARAAELLAELAGATRDEIGRRAGETATARS